MAEDSVSLGNKNDLNVANVKTTPCDTDIQKVVEDKTIVKGETVHSV